VEAALCPVLIGREQELSTLEDALLATRRGEGQVVLLAGDAGMGKTRLATELQRRARRLGMNTLWGGCSEAELPLPYLPFLEAIGNYLADTDVEALRAKLGPVRRELAHLFPQLEPAGVAPDDDSTQGRLRMYEAVLALLHLAAGDNGILLLIEDLHWADSSSRELLDYLTRRLRNGRVMVLVTYRSDEMHRRHPLLPMVHAWRKSSAASIVELEPLTPDKMAEMVIAIFDLGDEGIEDDTREFLHSRTEGNPFVLEEMLKAAVDRGDIFRIASGWTRKALADFRLPESVRDTILLRLDRLSSQQIEVLRAAAVLGTAFSYDALPAVCGRSEPDVRGAIEACVMQQLLVDDPRRHQSGYRFRHALTREAIYGDIITPERMRLHGLAADALNADAGDPLEVSQHLLSAGRTAEALPLCLEGAAKAEAEYAHADAAALYERVLPLVVDFPQRAAILCRLGTAYQNAGQPTAGLDYLEAGIALLERQGNTKDVAHFLIILSRCKWEMGKSREALGLLERARAELEPAGPSADLALAYVRLANMRIVQLDGAGCAALARRAIAIAEAAGAEDVLVQARLYLGDGLASSGHLDEGLAILDSSLSQAMDRGLFSVAVIAFNNASSNRIFNLRAAEVLERLPIIEAMPESVGKAVVRNMTEGLAAYQLGDLARAARAFMEVERVSRLASLNIWLYRSGTWLADCLFGLGSPGEAYAKLTSREVLVDFQDRIDLHICVMRNSLAMGNLEAAASAASLIFDVDVASLAEEDRSQLASWSTWSFIDAGQAESASKAARIGLGDGTNVLVHNRGPLQAGLALLDGDHDTAIKHLRGSLQSYDAAGYHTNACPIRRRLARLLLERDEAEGAKAELQKVFDVASRLGMVVERQLATEGLASLGVTVHDETEVQMPVATVTGERYVTVLFIDVRGYTAMTRGTAPPELADIVATLQRWSSATVAKHHGIVDKFAGDAVMATFNVSGAHIDHAQHALNSAIAMRDKAGAMGLRIGAGLATGPAVVGSLSEGANVSVIGETTNLASRLQAKAEGGEILLSPETYRRVRVWLDAHGYAARVEELDLKGFDETVTAYRLPATETAALE
jgi:class 3 adenylate cyclase